MCEVQLYVYATGQTFVKKFDDLRKARVFVNKCRFSQKVLVLSTVCDTCSQYRYVEYGE